MPKINGGTLRGLPVPIAPLGEMEGIANVIDKALGAATAVASQVEACGKHQVDLDASILAKAFRGELTSNLSND